jgi:hypothetical protein
MGNAQRVTIMRASSLWLWTALALALIVRVWALGAHSLLLDEAFVAVGARDMLRNGTPMWDAISNAPFVWIVAHTLGLAGLASPFFVRLPSAVFGVASIVPLYLLARRMFGERTAIFAAFLYALHPFAIAFSRVLFADPSQVFYVICGWLAFDIELAYQARPKPRAYFIAIFIWGMAFMMKYNAVVPGAAWLLAGVLAERYTLRSAFLLGLAMTAGNLVTLIIWPYDATIWLAAFLEKSTGYDVANSALYFWSKSHLVLFALTEIVIVGGLIIGFSKRNPFSHGLRHTISFLLIFIVTVTVLGRTFERYLIVSVPIACILLAATADWLIDRSKGDSANRLLYRISLAGFILLLAFGYTRAYVHYLHYLKNDVDLSSLTTTVSEIERQGHRGFWLIPEPIGAYYLGFTQHYSRSAGVQAHDSLASQNYFEFSGAPYSEETSEYRVLVARRLAHTWGIGNILASPKTFMHAVDSEYNHLHVLPLPSANYFESALVRSGDALIMAGGTRDLLGEPILERLDTTKLPPTFSRLPLDRFTIFKAFGCSQNDTTIEHQAAKAWILLRK